MGVPSRLLIDSMSAHSNMFLIGFMGTGKTTVGRALADRLRLRFVDMDDVIVDRAGKSIPEIFAEDGEPAFRALERQVAHDLSCEIGLVVATGGGVILDPANMEDFCSGGLVVCLSAHPDAVLDRVEGDTNRPLLAGERTEKRAKMVALLEKRQPLYGAVPNQVDTTDLTADEVVDRVASLYSAAG
jgi:shikimate kinase